MQLTTPVNSVSVGASYNLVGGGANTSYNITWPGSLITESYPSATKTWSVKSKDHIYNCPASIESYAIGLPTTVSGFSGQLEVQMLTGPTDSGNSLRKSEVALASGWVPAGAGGRTTFSTGRMLIGLRPPYGTSTVYKVESKDLKYHDSGDTKVYGFMIRKKP